MSFSTFKLLLFFHRAKHWTTFGPLFFAKRPKGVISSSSIYYYHFFVIFSSTEFQPFFMHNKYVLIFLLAFNLVSFFPLYLKRSVADTSKFSVLQKKKMYKTKLTKWHNVLKPTESELQMKICLLTLYLNYFHEKKLLFGRTLKKLFLIFFISSAA